MEHVSNFKCFDYLWITSWPSWKLGAFLYVKLSEFTFHFIFVVLIGRKKCKHWRTKRWLALVLHVCWYLCRHNILSLSLKIVFDNSALRVLSTSLDFSSSVQSAEFNGSKGGTKTLDRHFNFHFINFFSSTTKMASRRGPETSKFASLDCAQVLGYKDVHYFFLKFQLPVHSISSTKFFHIAFIIILSSVPK